MKIYAQFAFIFGGLIAGLFGLRSVEFCTFVPGMAWFLWDVFRQPADGPRPQPRPSRRR